MPSPFPGMDPYLEGQVWSDFHHAYINSLRNALMPLLLPRYVALIEERVYLEHQPEPALRRVTPDVAVLRDSSRVDESQGALAGTSGANPGVAVMVKPVTMPIVMPEEMTQTYVEIRLRESHELVSVIEMLSPTNKSSRSDGFGEYLLKRVQILRTPVHLLEIDLRRAGKRMPLVGEPPPADYYVVLSPSSTRPLCEVWPITLRDRLPVIPLPLLRGDPAVPLDLQACLDETYDRSYYGSFLDYEHGTTPPLSIEQLAYLAKT